MAGRDRRVGVAVAVLAVLLVGAVIALVARRVTDDGPRVLIVGDSVTEQSEAPLRDRFGWAGTLDLRAHSGFRTDELLATAREGVEEGRPDIGVFMPGYNDVLQEVAADTDALEEMVDLADQVPCAVWFLLPVDGAYSTDQVTAWNERVERLVAETDHVEVVTDWRDLVDAAPEFAFTSERDAVHPNERGQAAIADAMAAAVDRHCR